MVDYQGRYIQHQLGNYRLIKLLSWSHFTEVYLSEHVHLATRVVIKLMTAELIPEEIEHFRNEVRDIFELEHSNMVRVFDYGLYNNIPYIVMSYVPNGSLRDLYHRGFCVPLATIVKYVKQIAAALQYIHDEGLIHRNVKPGNILINGRNQILLSDFGIVTVYSSSNPNRLQNQIDTWVYLAPEQIQGQPVHASDQYALGVIVYEWLCGRPPFEGAWYNLDCERLNIAPQTLSERVSGIPSSVEQVVMRALAQDPMKRFPNVQAFASALEEASKRLPIGTPLQKHKGHEDAWINITWSPNGKYLASCSYAGEVQIWNTTNWKLICTSGRYEKWVKTVAWSQDSAYLAFGNHIGEVWIWDATNRKLIPTKGKHNGLVKVLAWSPDSKRIVSSSDDKTTKVWDAKTAECLVSYIEHPQAISVITWSPNGNRLVFASGNLAQVRDVRTNRSLFSRKTEAEIVKVIIWSPDENRIAVQSVPSEYSERETIQIWDVSRRKYLSSMNLGYVHKRLWSKDGERLITLSDEYGSKTVQIWNVNTGKCLFSYAGYLQDIVAWTSDGSKVAFEAGKRIKVWNASTGEELICSSYDDLVTDLAWSPDETKLASSSHDGKVHVWDANTREHLLGYRGGARRVSWSPDGAKIASISISDCESSSSYTIQVRDAKTGHCIITYKGHSAEVSVLAWSKDGTRIASVSGGFFSLDKTIQVWDTNKGEHIASFKEHVGSITELIWSLDENRLISSGFDKWGSKDKTTHVWDANTGACLFSFVDHSDNIGSMRWNAVAWAPDGNKIAFGSADKIVQIWDANMNQCLFNYTEHSGEISCVVWAKDGSRVASAATDDKVQIWDATSGKSILTYTGHTSVYSLIGIDAVVWSPDGASIASGAYGKVQVWSAETGEHLFTYPEYSQGLAWSPDGKKLAFGSYSYQTYDHTVQIWDICTGQSLFSYRVSGYVSAIAWSPDGKKLSFSDSGYYEQAANSSVQICDVGTGECLITYRGHSDAVTGLVWSPNEKKLASCSYDGTVQVWHEMTGELIFTYKGHTGGVNAAAWSPDGTRIASVSYEIHIWQA